MRDSAAPHSDGFTLIELLVVMIVTGLLAGIAVPVFLNQRRAAHDTAVVAAVTNLGQEVATTFVDGGGPTGLTLFTGADRRVEIATTSETLVVPMSKGAAFPTSGAWSNLSDEQNWCVSLTDPAGSTKTYRFVANAGLQRGTC